MSDNDAAAGRNRDNTRLQLALLTVALFVMVAFQSVQLIRERSNLAELWTNQEPTIQEGLKLRRQLDALAGETARLAADGDAGAGTIIDDLRRQGITVKPPAASH